MKEHEQSTTIGRPKLAMIYLGLWFGSGLIAALFHISGRPDYISLKVCLIGAIANLFGPWARPIAIGWPNAGKAPPPPFAIAGAIVAVVILVLILRSMFARKKWLQIVCIMLYVPSIGAWIYLGAITLMACAS